MITSNATHVINSLCGMYNVNDPGGAYRDAPTVQLGEMGNSPAPGGANGLIGLSRPWGGTIVTGTKYGPIRVTVEVHDTRPPADGIDDYSDVVELDFTVVSGRVVLSDWDGEPFYDLIVSSGNWRLRVHARGADEGAARNWDPDDEPVEEHLLQFFPGPKLGETMILARDVYGAQDARLATDR